LQRCLFTADTSVIMTSATLSTENAFHRAPAIRQQTDESSPPSSKQARAAYRGLTYFARRVGGERAAQLQVGSPFDYQRQMKLFITNKMPDPREEGYRDALIHWIEHFVKLTHGKAFILFTNFKLMLEVGE